MSELFDFDEYYTQCDLQFYLNFSNEIYDLRNYPVWVALYLTFQWYGILGLLFNTFLLQGNVIKFYYLGLRQLYASQGIEQFEQQQYWDLMNLNQRYRWPFAPIFDIGMWRCWVFKWAYESFHWFYLIFVDP